MSIDQQTKANSIDKCFSPYTSMLWLHKQFSVSSCRLLYMPIIISMVVHMTQVILHYAHRDSTGGGYSTDPQYQRTSWSSSYTRLSFSVSSEPSIFQKTMVREWRLPCAILMIDILVSGKSKTDHLHNPGEVFQKLQAQCIRIVMNCLTLYCSVFTHAY